MGGKITKNKSFNWTKPRKKRTVLITRFLSVLLYTRNYDLLPNSILLEDIPFPTSAENWTMQEYNIWSSLLNVLEIRSNRGLINKVEIQGKNYVEMKFINDIYDVGFNILIDYLRNDDYYWKKSQNIFEENTQENFIVPKRSLSPISFYSDYSLDALDILDENVSNIVPFEQVEELLIKFKLQKDKYGITCKGKNKSYKSPGDVWIWKKSNRNSGNSGNSEISILNF